MTNDEKTLAQIVIHGLVQEAHQTAREHGWWKRNRNIAETLFKITMEVAEAGQALENGIPPDKHLSDYDAFTVELADIVIRVFDLAGANDLKLGQAIVDKMEFNQTRPYRHGKEF